MPPLRLRNQKNQGWREIGPFLPQVSKVMLIFLYGQDTYRMHEKLNEIIENYRKAHKSGLSLKYFEEEKFNLNEITNEVQTVSMFEEKKLIILKNLSAVTRAAVKGGKEDSSSLTTQVDDGLLEFLKKIKNSEDTNIVIYEENKIKATSPLVKFLKNNAKTQEFSMLEGEKLKNWVRKKFLTYEVEVASGVVEKLINFVGNDLWQLNNEIKKLVNYKLRRVVEEKDIDLLVKPKIESDIFKTIDAIAQKNKKQALTFLHKHLEKGDNPLYLFSMINYQFRNLLIIKDLIERNRPYYAILKTANLHPFVVKKSYEQAGKFSFPELKKIYQKIFQVDLAIKTGKINSETGLDLLLSEI